MKIGILSDTHGVLTQNLLHFFESVDEIWHAGDMGNAQVVKTLEEFKFLRAVYGNIDGEELRRMLNETEMFECAGAKVLMTHIGGYPKRYEKKVHELLYANRPQIFVCGHSHILKVMYDKQLNCLHINPGAAGKYGLHNVRTAVRFEINNGQPSNIEIGEWAK
ncbi:MAG: metallophosphoesterase family protein [Bacteroidales bacterium]